MRQPKILTTLRTYDLSQFGADLLAGVTVAMVALPLSLAIAIASGADPGAGLTTAIVAGFLISALGGSRVQIGGPTGAFIVVVFGIIAEHGHDGLVIATFMAGLMLLVAGYFRAGRLIAYVPEAVVNGFTIGIAVMGASKGAEAALLVASRRPDVSAVVAGMPSSVAWNGVNWASGGQSERASWTAGGQEVATMPFGDWNQADGIISVYRTVEDPARSAEAARAAIPIERARARVLLVCGEAETMWPACPMARQVAARSTARSGPDVTVLAYKDAGHFVFGPPIPPGHPFHERLGEYGGSVTGNAAARADSWPRVIAFLKQAPSG